ncbi:MAG: energy transducer TonB [Dysgonamonadaceae bacterium]|jgi:TonB family protein|nr:energy transducer TonB [Dysgonamonadaceae bacterium]
MKLTKEQTIGYSLSIALSALILLLLSLIYLYTEVAPELEGIPINFGTVDAAFGAEEPAGNPEAELATEEVTPVPESVLTPTPPAPQPKTITQDREQTAAIDAEKQKTEKERIRRQKEEIDNQMAIFGKGGSSNSQSEGTAATGSGNQGSVNGNAPSGKYESTGGKGTFDLGGRELRGQNEVIGPSKESIVEEGVIVVEITVDPHGNVIQAQCRLRGTNIDNPQMRRLAEEAAKRNKFTTINGSTNQTGTITYKYNLR